MIWRTQRTSKTNEFVSNNSPSDIIGTPGDNWKSYLSHHGGTGDTFYDLESSWINGTASTLLDNIGAYIANLGFLAGYIFDRIRAFLSSILSPEADYYLQESSLDKYLLEDGSGFYILE